MNVSTASVSMLSGRKLSRVRTAWWTLFILYTIFTIFELGQQLGSLLQMDRSRIVFLFHYPIYILETIVSWLLAIILFRKKSSDWTVVLVTAMFFSGVSLGAFWTWILNHTSSLLFTIDPGFVTQLISVPFLIFSSVIRLGVFLTFPTGQWISPGAKRLFWTGVIIFIIVRFVLTIFDMADEFVYGLYFPFLSPGFFDRFADAIRTISYTTLSAIWLLAGSMLFAHYRRMQNSVQRQQVKWIVYFFFMSVVASALLTLLYTPMYLNAFFDQQGELSDFYDNIFPWLALPSSLLSLGLVVVFSMSIYRYRLWDVDILINKTAVYGGLSILLAGIVLISASIVDYAIKQLLGEQPSIWSAIITAVPAVTLFNPLRDRLQAFVDKRFKPEEVNFSETFVEFQPEIQARLSTSRIIQILSEQVKKQLNIEFARIYLLGQDDHLQYAELAPTSEEHQQLVLEEERLTQLKEGKIVVDEDGIPYSLLVPLLVPRARIPDFLGVIVLGRRLENKGYSTQILKNLETLGADAGKAIYLSKIREQTAAPV